MNNSFDSAFDVLDIYFGQEIIYKTYVDSIGGNAALGIESDEQYKDNKITARVREITLEEVKNSGGAYVLGDIEVKVRKEAVSYDDVIIYDGNTYEPFDIKKIWLKGLIGYRLRCRKQ